MNQTSHSSIMVNRDEEHLKLLGLFHLIIAGLNALAIIIFVLVPLLMGPSFFSAVQIPPVPPEKLIFGLLLGILIVAVYAFNGWSLRNKKYRISCMILSCIECITNLPYGMILGLSAIFVLRRESTAELFKRATEA